MLNQTFQYRLFFYWTIYFGVLCYLIWLGWNLGILSNIFTGDPTKLTYLISLFFIGGTLHCGIRSYYLACQINAINEFDSHKRSYDDDDSLPAKFLNTVAAMLQSVDTADNDVTETDKQLITEIFSSEAHALHEVGWFITSLLIKLGLLGTVIGFVLMLQPLSTLESFDLGDIQSILANMTSGMSVALNTTLLGLVSSMLLSFQYLLMDRGADELVVRTVHYMETCLVPDLQLQSS